MSDYYNYFQLIPKFQSKNMYKILCYSVICYLLKMSDRRKCYRSNTKNFMLFLLFLLFLGSKTDTLNIKIVVLWKEVWFSVKRYKLKSKERFPVKGYEFLSKEIVSCQKKWFPVTGKETPGLFKQSVSMHLTAWWKSLKITVFQKPEKYFSI
jgi:hypothetical protein